MSVKGGYHILNLQNKDLQYSPTIPGAYESVEGSYQKPILLSGIVIGGVEKADVYRMPVVSGSSYVFENVYGYDLTLTDSDGLSLASTQWATRNYVDNKVSTKTVYCHPLEIYHSEAGLLTAMIFSGSSEPINSFTKLKNAIIGFAGERYGRLIVSGGYKDSDNSKTIIASDIVYVVADEKFKVLGVATDGTIYALANGIDITDVPDVAFTIADDVNAIN